MRRTRPTAAAALLGLLALPAAASPQSGEATLAPEEVPDRGPVLAEPHERGGLVLAPPTTREPAAKIVDGHASDWVGTAAGIGGNSVWDAGEHIHSDFLFDAHGADDGGDQARIDDFAGLLYEETRTQRIDQLLRTSGSQLGVPAPLGAPDEYGDVDGGLDVGDLREVRWAASEDGATLHLLAGVTNLTDPARLGVLVLADHGGTSAEPMAVGPRNDLHTSRFDTSVLLTAQGASAYDIRRDSDLPLPRVQVAVSTEGWENHLEAAIPAGLLSADGPDGPTIDVAVVTGRVEDDGSFTPLNAAYRHVEPLEIFNDRLQALDLLAGTVDRFSSGPIAVADLVAGRTETMLHPGPGYHEVQLRSAEDISRESGDDGIWQPYGLYVPTGFAPGTPTPTTFWLHYRGGKAHSGVVINPRLVTQLGEEPTNLVVFPHARGTSEWYVTESHQDFWEAYEDVHGRFPEIDPQRRYLSGYSMGGYGSWLLATLYPDRFAAAFVQSGAITQGMWAGGGPDDEPDPTFGQGWVEANDGDARAQLTYRALESLRHVPFAIDHGTDDELVPITGLERMAGRLTELGYAHRFTRFVGYEHFTQAVMDEWADGAAYLQRHTAPTDPRQVTYAVVPVLVWAVNNVDPPEGASFGFAPDGAYWVDDVVARDVPIVDEASGRPADDAKAVVDLVAEPIAAPATAPAPDAGAASPPEHSTPYVRTGLQHLEAPDPTEVLTPVVANAFGGTLTNVASVSLDTARMGLDLSADAESFAVTLTVDGPTTVRLVDAATGGRTLFDGHPGEDGGLTIRRDGRDLLITLDGAGTWSYHVESGTVGIGG